MIVDTSVVLDVVERQLQAAIVAVAEIGQRSIRSDVVLGELHAGVKLAELMREPNAVQRKRRESLTFYQAISEHRDAEALPTASIAEIFGEISALNAHAKLKVGQNDRWILASGLHLETTVLTSDSQMHDLGELISAGRRPPESPLTKLVAKSPIG